MNRTKPTVTNIVDHKDKRGNFLELLRYESLKQKKFGQLSLTTINPHQQKGNHYHKIRWEWFTVFQGSVEMKLTHVITAEKVILHLSSKKPQILCIPPYWNHTLYNKNTKEAVAVVYSSISFKKIKPDVYILK